MRKVKMLFDESKIELHIEGQNGIEYIDYEELKDTVCAYFGLPPGISVLELDFETEQLAYELDDAAKAMSMPGLAKQEQEIFMMLGYEYADLGNAAGIVDAFIAGEISGQLFQVLLGIEALDNERNPGIEEFLKSLGGQ